MAGKKVHSWDEDISMCFKINQSKIEKTAALVFQRLTGSLCFASIPLKKENISLIMETAFTSLDIFHTPFYISY